jgi:hypothetical protein
MWLCGYTLIATALAAQCTNPYQVPNGTTWTSGTMIYSDQNAIAAANVTISGSASVTFGAGNCIDLQTGFHATAGTAGTTFHAWLDAPSAISVAPASGSGFTQQFTWTVSDPSGYAFLTDVSGLIVAGQWSGINACQIRYNQPSNLLFLATDGGGWMTGLVPGSPYAEGNSQCFINAAQSSITHSGNLLSVTVSVTFQPGFAGDKNNYLSAWDATSGLTTWDQQVGTWTVPSTGSVAQPTFSPASGTYSSGQSVIISTTTPGATIRYTTDGSMPSSTYGTPYTVPVAVNSSMTLKAIAYESGWADSSVSSAAYLICGGTIPSREYIRLGGRVIAIANCGAQ